jgi:hypothetical protein
VHGTMNLNCRVDRVAESQWVPCRWEPGRLI